MTAQTRKAVDSKSVYSHIFKKGVENLILFKDEEDYQVFKDFLKDYLTAPANPEKLKKTFSVNGRTFKGVPHQPKNFFNQIELIAYNLMPDHFHLLVKEITEGSLGKLIRSLSTRYAIYYNKKYQRRGSPYAGTYKSAQVKGASQLLQLSRYLHREPLIEKGGYSSYEEYIGERETLWVKPEAVLSYYDKSENKYFKDVKGYNNFVEKYQLKQEEKEILKGIIIDKKPRQTGKKELKPETKASFKRITEDPVSEPRAKIPEFIITSTIVFVLLFTIGVRNVLTSSIETTEFPGPLFTPTPQVSGLEDETSEEEAILEVEDITTENEKVKEATSEAELVLTETEIPELLQAESSQESEAKTMIVITITDGSDSVNIRSEPTMNSEAVGKVLDGEIFKYVSESYGWYQIDIDDGYAFVSKRYAEILGI